MWKTKMFTPKWCQYAQPKYQFQIDPISPQQQIRTTGLDNDENLIHALYSLSPCIGSPDRPTVPRRGVLASRSGVERLRSVRPSHRIRRHSTAGTCATRLFVDRRRSPDHIMTVSASPWVPRAWIIAVSWHTARPPAIQHGRDLLFRVVSVNRRH
jgi:hypothetical protein